MSDIGDEVCLGNPPDENGRHAELQGNATDQGPGSLIACYDGVTCGDGPGKFVNDKGEVRWAPEDALEIGEATTTGAPFPVPELEVVAYAAHYDVHDRWRIDDL